MLMTYFSLFNYFLTIFYVTDAGRCDIAFHGILGMNKITKFCNIFLHLMHSSKKIPPLTPHESKTS